MIATGELINKRKSIIAACSLVSSQISSPQVLRRNHKLFRPLSHIIGSFQIILISCSHSKSISIKYDVPDRTQNIINFVL